MQKVLGKVWIGKFEELPRIPRRIRTVIKVCERDVAELGVDKPFPPMYHFHVGPGRPWDDGQAEAMAHWVLERLPLGDVLIVSDAADSRAVLALARVLLLYGLSKDDALELIRSHYPKARVKPAEATRLPQEEVQPASRLFGPKPKVTEKAYRQWKQTINAASLAVPDADLEKAVRKVDPNFNLRRQRRGSDMGRD